VSAVKRVIITKIRLGFIVEILYKNGEPVTFSAGTHELEPVLNVIPRYIAEHGGSK
jgi:hypothetical protein